MAERIQERMTTIALRAPDEGALEGIFMPASGNGAGAVVAPPHPQYGGSMDSPVVGEVAHAAREAGLASLRFNWRGVGASAGTVSGEATDAVADYRAALAYLLDTVPGVVYAAGYSFGAAAALLAAVGEPRVRRLVLVAPPPAFVDRAVLADFGGDVRLMVGAGDAIAPAAELAEIAAALPRATFAAIPDADHFFMRGLAEVGQSCRAAFAPAS